jgi:hypothetical protein
MQAPAPASTEITLTDESLIASATLIRGPRTGPLPERLRLDIPGKTSRHRHTVAQRLLLPPLFVAPTCLEQPDRIGHLLQLWHSAFRAGDGVQLILPVRPGPDHIDRAIAAVQEAAAASGVDLDVLADMVLTTVPGQASEDVAGVASARACWIALDGEAVPSGSGFTPVLAEAEALRTAARQLAPYALADPDSHSLADPDSQSQADPADGPA